MAIGQLDFFAPGATTQPNAQVKEEASIVESVYAEAEKDKEKKEECEEQLRLLDVEEDWRAEWRGMPEFDQQDRGPYKTIYVHFETSEAVKAFSQLVGQRLRIETGTKYSDSIWFPSADIERYADKAWVGPLVGSRYPIYVPTKGRWASAYTIRALEKLGVPYFAVVQPQEREGYEAVVKGGIILELPPGLDGLVPARNWIMDHSLARGDARHWQIDDNINGFFRLNANLKVEVESGVYFRAMEDFSDRYENIAVSGPNYFMFASRKSLVPAFQLNTRIYSCSLVNNAMPYRWRGVYNDDTDLCLQALKGGMCTVLFNAFLCYKITTMTIPGGNTPIYQGNGRLRMAEELRDRHPDVVTITEKWGRSQHLVDYSPFRRNRLVLRPGLDPRDSVNDYGMRLVPRQSDSTKGGR